MRLFLRGILVFSFLLLFFSYPIAYFIGENFHTHNKQNWVLRKTRLKLDYAVLGSSRVFNMIDISSLDKSYGKKGINIGSSGSNYAENYLILSEFLSKNKISTLILNVDEFSFNSVNSFSYPFHDYEFLHLTDKYDSIVCDFIPTWKCYLWKIIPAAKYFEFNNKFTVCEVEDSGFDKTMGSKLENIKEKNEELKFRKRQNEMNEMDKKYFINIIQLCSEKKIKVVLITTPIYLLDRPENDKPFKRYIDSVSMSRKIPYFGFENLLDCYNVKFFTDNTHTNSVGSREYSSNLGKKLKEENL